DRLAGPVELANRGAGDSEGGGGVVQTRHENEGEPEIVGVLVAECGSAVEALVETGTGLIGVGVGECDAEDQESSNEGVRHVGLSGKRERFNGQGNGAG